MSGRAVKVDDGRLFYNIDTSPGQSGSGVWAEDDDEKGKYLCVAVHTYGGNKMTGNSGTLINEEKLVKINTWLRSLKTIWASEATSSTSKRARPN